MSWKTLELTGFLWTDESLLVLSCCILLLCVGLLFLGGGGAAVVLRTLELKLPLALHTVPHAVTEVDQKA